jgi:hypothetical protein
MLDLFSLIITEEENVILCSIPSEEEVFEALTSLSFTKAPCSDGFIALSIKIYIYIGSFSQASSSTLSLGLYRMVRSISESSGRMAGFLDRSPCMNLKIFRKLQQLQCCCVEVLGTALDR